jgi:preprotein translocase SecY subunit
MQQRAVLPQRRPPCAAVAGAGGGGVSRPRPAAAAAAARRVGRLAVRTAARKAQGSGGSGGGSSSSSSKDAAAGPATARDEAPPRAPPAPPPKDGAAAALTPLQRARLAAQAAVAAADAEKAAAAAGDGDSGAAAPAAAAPSAAERERAAAAVALGMGGPSVSDKIRAAAAAATEQQQQQARPASPSPSSAAPASSSSSPSSSSTPSSLAALSTADDDGFSWSAFFSGPLPGKLAQLLALLALSRAGVYVRLPGVDVDAFGASVQANGLLGYVDALSGGSISRVGLFSLGIIPYINASIVLQLFSTAFPSLKKMQREDGPQGRARFQYYTKLAAFAFAIAQALGQLSYIRPYVSDFSPAWLAGSTAALVAGAMALVYTADAISELRLGNGTSVLIFAGIASSLPSSLSALLATAGASAAAGAAADAPSGTSGVAIYGVAFLLTTLGIIYVQEAERRIPVNYPSAGGGGGGGGGGSSSSSSSSSSPSSSARSGARQQQPYLPFKVNATGVMPLIFASSLLGLPAAAARYLDTPALDGAAAAVSPGGPLYLPVNVVLIAFFNYYYTFLQLEPKDLAEQLKRAGAAIPGVRPGKATAEFVAGTLSRMSLLGSAFLGALAAAPAAVEAITHLTALRGFAGTSVLIMVGVATDSARRIRAEQAMAKYDDTEKAYERL